MEAVVVGLNNDQWYQMLCHACRGEADDSGGAATVAHGGAPVVGGATTLEPAAVEPAWAFWPITHSLPRAAAWVLDSDVFDLDQRLAYDERIGGGA
jgi:hypothetical protein